MSMLGSVFERVICLSVLEVRDTMIEAFWD